MYIKIHRKSLELGQSVGSTPEIIIFVEKELTQHDCYRVVESTMSIAVSRYYLDVVAKSDL